MPYHVMLFNLKEGHTEDELVKDLEEYDRLAKEHIQGWGGYKLYKHYYFGANIRRYQLWLKIESLTTIENEIEAKYNAGFAKLVKEKITDKGLSFYDIVDVTHHIDEVVSEVYPTPERPSSTHKG